ncbi:MAG: hypothetical protein WC725_05095 [Patescibacteria group bacterium]|jgi:hypothetical protein
MKINHNVESLKNLLKTKTFAWNGAKLSPEEQLCFATIIDIYQKNRDIPEGTIITTEHMNRLFSIFSIIKNNDIMKEIILSNDDFKTGILLK